MNAVFLKPPAVLDLGLCPSVPFMAPALSWALPLSRWGRTYIAGQSPALMCLKPAMHPGSSMPPRTGCCLL